MRHFLYFLSVVCACGMQAQDKYFLAEKAFFSGNSDQALSIINQKIEGDAKAPDYLLRALIHDSQDFLSNANDDFVKAISLDSEFYEAYFHYAEYLKKTGASKKAIASLTLLLNKIDHGETKGVFFKIDQNGMEPTTVTSLAGMKAEILSNRSTSYQQLGMIDLALSDMNMALSLGETPGRYVNRALLFSELGEDTMAIADLEAATVLSPSNSLAWYNLFLYDQSIDIPVGLAEMEEFGPMLAAKGVEAMEAGNSERAGELFSKALELNPNDVNLLLNAGRLDYKNQLFESALMKFEKAISLDPIKKEARYLIGNAYFGQGNFKMALEQYSAYLKTDPTFADVWFNAGMAYLELEDETNACSCLERASNFGMKEAGPFFSEYCTKE